MVVGLVVGVDRGLSGGSGRAVGGGWFFTGVLMMAGRRGLGAWSRLIGFVDRFIPMNGKMAVAVAASFILMGALFLVSDALRVGGPISWSDAVRSGLARPAGRGCSTRRW